MEADAALRKAITAIRGASELVMGARRHIFTYPPTEREGVIQFIGRLVINAQRFDETERVYIRDGDGKLWHFEMNHIDGHVVLDVIPEGQAMSDMDNDSREMRERSGSVDSADFLVRFLYILLRDYITAGEAESIMEGHIEGATDKLACFSNGWLARHAADLARRLRPEPDRADIDFIAEQVLPGHGHFSNAADLVGALKECQACDEEAKDKRVLQERDAHTCGRFT